MQRIVVVGASAAGLAAVETLRREGFSGEVVLVGDEPHAPYDRPPLSKQVLSGAWDPSRVTLRPSADLAALDLDLRLGVGAVGLGSAGVELVDGSVLGYDGLIVCTGVRPRTLPWGGHVLRGVDDARRLRSRLTPGCRLVVVGAGFLGAEVAAVAVGLGCSVTLIDPLPSPMCAALGSEVGVWLGSVHAAAGVEVLCGVPVDRFDESSVVVGGRELPCDDVLVCIGSIPNTDWLSGSGVPVGDGVLCDEFCRAGEFVFAAGDVARWFNPAYGVEMRIEHRTHAGLQATAAARNLLAVLDERDPTPFSTVPYVWSDQYDLRLQVFGYLRGHDEMRVLDGAVGSGPFVAGYYLADRLLGVLCVNTPPRELRRWRGEVEQAVRAGRPAPSEV
ncbi:NAD(P)/FAD-dependent oxidoreductase [Nakamurella sp. YIM 132087]|uniref:NAD(P)/FAD-dependent oxidoreductase n=1 Tax=Nakamurella alba TaxID=2665158 RepID=A0A7K1FM38_9ACTN|nr:FAD-dependent oxidoreductase [Nakamurella alba]MTD15166.1 NAD(P)/FAD-dependent oxidoreductase [Nakamurella alba]